MFKKVLLAQAPKFGVVDAEAIIPKMAEFAEAQTKINDASKTYESEYAKISEELQKKYTEFQELEKDPATLQSIKERRMQEIQELDKKAQQFAQTAQQDLQRQQAQLMQPIQEKIMKAIQTVGAAGSYTFIFDAEQSYYAGSDVINVTPDVKTTLGVK